MIKVLPDIFFVLGIISLFVILLILKKHDVILSRYERKEEYKGFFKDVLMYDGSE